MSYGKVQDGDQVGQLPRESGIDFEHVRMPGSQIVQELGGLGQFGDGHAKSSRASMNSFGIDT
jgi:hypothetical protein